MDNKWKQDPRVQNMDPQKLQYLNELTERINKTPKNQLLASFATISMEAKTKGIQFNDQETDLLVSILSTNMNSLERQRLDTLRMLSGKLAK